LFVAFAFVVLLGTVFPLLYEAFRGQQVTVGAPYFDAMAVPIGIALLFMMAVGPALPWRKATAGVMRARLVVPAWIGALVVVGCVAGGLRGLAPLAAFGLGGFAAAANVRQLVLSTRGARRAGVGAWHGFVGRANGGMVVHLGVVVIAVALAAATSFGHRGEVTLRPGQSTLSDGHRITYVGLTNVRTAASTATEALVRVDGRGILRPAVTQFGAGTQAVGTPAIDSGPVDDVYLTVDNLPGSPGGAVTIGVTVQPLVAWLWAGGGLVVLGSLLAAVPGRRRRATDPVSAPVPAVAARARAAPGPPGENEDGVLDGVAAGADVAGSSAAPGDGVSGGRHAPDGPRGPDEPDRPRPVPVATP
jgi:cytochrome c-type biogenesis protein CcmF